MSLHKQLKQSEFFITSKYSFRPRERERERGKEKRKITLNNTAQDKCTFSFRLSKFLF